MYICVVCSAVLLHSSSKIYTHTYVQFVYMFVKAEKCNWRASEASETLSGVYKFELVRYIYIYIYVWRYVCHISSACYAYVIWAELVHCHFLYVPAVLNVVTTGNGTALKMF